ncbi:MFS transporter [Streptomyces rapamycinicus]
MSDPRHIDKSSRRALFASWLGWTFDGFETYALVLVGPTAVMAVGTEAQLADLPTYVSGLLAATLAGWALGGILAGFAADRLGRRRTLILSILWYALFTGLTALAPDYWWLLTLRFITGMGLGAEWGSATALIGELWPDRSRGRAAAVLQSGFGVGAVIAALAWYLLEPVGDNAWRYLFLIGTLPALIVLYVRRAVRDPEMWTSVRDRRRKAKAAQEAGNTVAAADRELLRSPFTAVFSQPHLRRRGLRLLVLTVVSVIGLYAVSAWIPAYTAQLAKDTGETGTDGVPTPPGLQRRLRTRLPPARLPGRPLGPKTHHAPLLLRIRAVVPVFFCAVHTRRRHWPWQPWPGSSSWASSPGCPSTCPNCSPPPVAPQRSPRCSTPHASPAHWSPSAPECSSACSAGSPPLPRSSEW